MPLILISAESLFCDNISPELTLYPRRQSKSHRAGRKKNKQCNAHCLCVITLHPRFAKTEIQPRINRVSPESSRAVLRPGGGETPADGSSLVVPPRGRRDSPTGWSQLDPGGVCETLLCLFETLSVLCATTDVLYIPAPLFSQPATALKVSLSLCLSLSKYDNTSSWFSLKTSSRHWTQVFDHHFKPLIVNPKSSKVACSIIFSVFNIVIHHLTAVCNLFTYQFMNPFAIYSVFLVEDKYNVVSELSLTWERCQIGKWTALTLYFSCTITTPQSALQWPLIHTFTHLWRLLHPRITACGLPHGE